MENALNYPENMLDYTVYMYVRGEISKVDKIDKRAFWMYWTTMNEKHFKVFPTI